MQYERLSSGSIFVHQRDFVLAIKPADISKERKQQVSSPLTPEETFTNRSLLCSMLWATQTREDIYNDVVQLQQRMLSPTVADLIQANAVLSRLQKNINMMGLHVHRLCGPCRLVGVADSSHATKLTSYAQEAGGVFSWRTRHVRSKATRTLSPKTQSICSVAELTASSASPSAASASHTALHMLIHSPVSVPCSMSSSSHCATLRCLLAAALAFVVL